MTTHLFQVPAGLAALAVVAHQNRVDVAQVLRSTGQPPQHNVQHCAQTSAITALTQALQCTAL